MTRLSRTAGRVTGWSRRTVDRSREQSELVDHTFRAARRYAEAPGGRLAAAIAYYGFFAAFALGLVAYAGLGFLLEHHLDLRDAVDQFLQENLPVLDTEHIAAGRGVAGGLGLAALVLTGVAWVDTLRSSQRLIWRLEQRPGNIVVRRALDVVVLVVLALLIGASVSLATGVERLLSGVPLLVSRPIGWVLTIGVNLVLAVALLAVLPRLRISPRRLFPPAVAVALGLFLLSTVGQLYIDRVQQNPAYTVVATAAGVLVYLYLVNQLVLGAAAWAATSRHGRMVDLSVRTSRLVGR